MLRWMVIGVGDITTKRVIPAIQEEARSELTAILTRHPEKARAFGAKIYTRLEEGLADPQVDAVYVASPVALHCPQTVAALHAGKHVLCEKPVGTNYAEAVAMTRTAAETGRVLGVAYYRRTYPKVARAMELILQGVIGRPVLAEASNHGWFNAEGGERSWLLDPAMAGGGPLYDIASHRIDLLNWFFGTPCSVSAHLANAIHANPVEDCATLLIEYESGVRGVVDVRWHCRRERDEFRITGTEGELDLTPLNSPRLVFPGGEEAIPAHANIHYPCVKNFVDHVLDGERLLSSGISAIWTDWVTEKAIHANRLR